MLYHRWKPLVCYLLDYKRFPMITLYKLNFTFYFSVYVHDYNVSIQNSTDAQHTWIHWMRIKNPHYMCVENQNQLTRLKYMTHEIINLSWYWQHFFHTMYIHTDTTHNLTGMTTPMINYRYIADLRQMQMSIVSFYNMKTRWCIIIHHVQPNMQWRSPM